MILVGLSEIWTTISKDFAQRKPLRSPDAQGRNVLLTVHRKNGIKPGCVSPLCSIPEREDIARETNMVSVNEYVLGTYYEVQLAVKWIQDRIRGSIWSADAIWKVRVEHP